MATERNKRKGKEKQTEMKAKILEAIENENTNSLARELDELKGTYAAWYIINIIGESGDRDAMLDEIHSMLYAIIHGS